MEVVDVEVVGGVGEGADEAGSPSGGLVLGVGVQLRCGPV